MFPSGLVVILVLTFSLTESKVDLLATPETIAVGLSSKFTLTCNVPVNHTMHVSSIHIYHSAGPEQNMSQLARIDVTGRIVTYLPNVASVSGHVLVNEDSNLTVEWVFPTSAQAGYYVCNVTLSGAHALPYHETQNHTVGKTKPDFVNVIQELRKMRSYVESKFGNQTEKWTQTYETFKSTHFIKLNVTGSSNSDYLLSKELNSTAMQSDVMCHLLGGYLAEVSPREEQDITQALRTYGNGPADLILIGGSDVDDTGNWLYMRNELPLKLNVSLPAAPGQDCLAFNTKASFRVVQISCSNPSSSGTSMFLCQIDT
ncbi:C-type lectin domain family 11 member A [Biomphalaria pfeifferi]|uniref:C-type lectin domain family 11 member A n=1 Tax=Biomphalaria pfeifferi TaxID=112525 RepID=A0AAD8BWW7_BIOPF|nr:C-type lectin domain family 11 member A [Biomphalaria pfeifferi]